MLAAKKKKKGSVTWSYLALRHHSICRIKFLSVADGCSCSLKFAVCISFKDRRLLLHKALHSAACCVL
jgi:hypothetical protein